MVRALIYQPVILFVAMTLQRYVKIRYQMNYNKSSLMEQTDEVQPIVTKHIFFEVLERVGTQGRYQRTLLAILCACHFLYGGLTTIPSYLFFQDRYVCTQTYPDQTCQQHVCSLPVEQREQFVPPPSMHTLGNQFGDHRCSDSKHMITLIQSLFLVGRFVGPLVVMLLGDLLGRKFIMVSSLLLALFGNSLVVFSPNLTVAGIFLFVGMFGCANIMYLSFTFLAECVAQCRREQYSVVIQGFNGSALLLNSLVFYLIGQWKVIMLVFYAFPALLTAMAFIYFVRDTPICLIMKYTPDKALQRFKFIAKVNKVTNHGLSEEQIKNVKARYLRAQLQSAGKQRVFSVIDLFRFPSLRGLTLLATLLMCTYAINYFAPPLMLGQFNFNVFVSGAVLGTASFVHYPFCYWFIPRVKRRPLAIACYTACMVTSAILLFVWKQGSDRKAQLKESILPLILLFVFYFSIANYSTLFFIYYNQVYPTQVRVIGTNLVNFVKGVLVALIPFIIDACLDSGFPVMLLFVIVSALSIVLSRLFPESYGKVPPEIIKELETGNQKESQQSLIDSTAQ